MFPDNTCLVRFLVLLKVPVILPRKRQLSPSIPLPLPSCPGPWPSHITKQAGTSNTPNPADTEAGGCFVAFGQSTLPPSHSRQHYELAKTNVLLLPVSLFALRLFLSCLQLTTTLKIFIHSPNNTAAAAAGRPKVDLYPPHGRSIHGPTTTRKKSCRAEAAASRGGRGRRPRTTLHHRHPPLHSAPLLLLVLPSSSSIFPNSTTRSSTSPTITQPCFQPLCRPRPRVPTTLRIPPRRQRPPSLHLSLPANDDARPHPA